MKDVIPIHNKIAETWGCWFTTLAASTTPLYPQFFVFAKFLEGTERALADGLLESKNSYIFKKKTNRYKLKSCSSVYEMGQTLLHTDTMVYCVF